MNLLGAFCLYNMLFLGWMAASIWRSLLLVLRFLCKTTAGTDDDLPPPHQNRFQRGGLPAGNGRSAPVNSSTLPRMVGDMEMQIHHIEQEAYSSVLRAFKAQSDAITWVYISLVRSLNSSNLFYFQLSNSLQS